MKVINTRKFLKNSKNDLIKRRIIAYGVITLIIILIMGIWGLTLLENLSSFFANVNGNSTTAVTPNVIPVSVPTLDSLPPATNQNKISVAGSAQQSAIITLYRNSEQVDSQIAGSDGSFNFHTESLIKGNNTFSVKSKLGAITSGLSNQVSVIYQTTPPPLSISSPTDGSSVSTAIVTVTGKTGPTDTVTINNQQEVVGSDGSFSGVVTLQSGSNTITYVAEDIAGNKTTVTQTVTYSQQTPQ